MMPKKIQRFIFGKYRLLIVVITKAWKRFLHFEECHHVSFLSGTNLELHFEVDLSSQWLKFSCYNLRFKIILFASKYYKTDNRLFNPPDLNQISLSQRYFHLAWWKWKFSLLTGLSIHTSPQFTDYIHCTNRSLISNKQTVRSLRAPSKIYAQLSVCMHKLLTAQTACSWYC